MKLKLLIISLLSISSLYAGNGKIIIETEKNYSIESEDFCFAKNGVAISIKNNIEPFLVIDNASIDCKELKQDNGYILNDCIVRGNKHSLFSSKKVEFKFQTTDKSSLKAFEYYLIDNKLKI
jgi:hypothetical protein